MGTQRPPKEGSPQDETGLWTADLIPWELKAKLQNEVREAFLPKSHSAEDILINDYEAKDTLSTGKAQASPLNRVPAVTKGKDTTQKEQTSKDNTKPRLHREADNLKGEKGIQERYRGDRNWDSEKTDVEVHPIWKGIWSIFFQ